MTEISYLHPNGAKQNWKYFSLIFIIFSLPLLGSFFLYNFSDVITLKSKNAGTLINTPIPLVSLNLRDREGRFFLEDEIHGRWVLVYHSGGPCSGQCGEDLVALEKVRMALGKDYRRTELLLLEPPPQKMDSNSEPFQVAGPVAVIAENDRKKLADVSGAADSGTLLFLADFRGNLMMSYNGKVDQQAVYEDLRWLLKVNKRAF